MSKGAQLNVVCPLVTENPEEWEMKVLQMSKEKLVVVDVHQDWSGPCEATFPTFSRIFMDTNAAEDRLAVYSGCLQHWQDQIQGILESFHPMEPGDKVDLDNNGCLPLFLFIKNQKIIATLKGIQGPRIVEIVADNLPAIKKVDAE